MKIDEIEIALRLTPRELELISYCVRELLRISSKHDLKEGFTLNKQDECKKISNSLNELQARLRGV